ncbi:hypothetical protein [Arsenicibacter rosenii]|uniref:Outer membrane protein beta-barrel domain-containing protein n=1 Tax=Arsenicibacter rosenii TaxID=1750698 RepID=A0A1S2VRA2_9BACT|nr:hypothetical protein [Arsenicibacter rosenii]OIN60696.1 hypothetical protein BLX24_00860 [Arsenicibacter rosenii]
MYRNSLLVWLWLAGMSPVAVAQRAASGPAGRPLTVSVFSHGISLPTVKPQLTDLNPGLRIGTEIYYRNRRRSQLFQTLNAGGYGHKQLQTALFVTTELGYRKFIGGLFVEGLLGVGALGASYWLKQYQPDGNGGYQAASAFVVKAVPSVSLGVGYRFTGANPVSVFVQEQAFGEVPFGFRGQPVLPHAALHVGMRMSLNQNHH